MIHCRLPFYFTTRLGSPTLSVRKVARPMDAPEHGQPLESQLLHVSDPEPDNSFSFIVELQADLNRQEVRVSQVQTRFHAAVGLTLTVIPHGLRAVVTVQQATGSCLGILTWKTEMPH